MFCYTEVWGFDHWWQPNYSFIEYNLSPIWRELHTSPRPSVGDRRDFVLDTCYGVPESGVQANCSERIVWETEGMGDKCSLSLFGGNHSL